MFLISSTARSFFQTAFVYTAQLLQCIRFTCEIRTSLWFFSGIVIYSFSLLLVYTLFFPLKPESIQSFQRSLPIVKIPSFYSICRCNYHVQIHKLSHFPTHTLVPCWYIFPLMVGSFMCTTSKLFVCFFQWVICLLYFMDCYTRFVVGKLWMTISHLTISSATVMFLPCFQKRSLFHCRSQFILVLFQSRPAYVQLLSCICILMHQFMTFLT